MQGDLRVGIHTLTEDTNYKVSRYSIVMFPDKPSVSQRWEVQFENGYGASVITGQTAFCDNFCPYEVAVLHDNSLCYHSPITDDVIGYLNLGHLEQTLDKIAQLPREPNHDYHLEKDEYNEQENETQAQEKS